MNLLDILVLVALISVFTVVFFAGLWRAIAALIALWVGLIGADIFGNPVGRFVYSIIPGIERITADFIGFVLAFIVIGVAVMYLTLRSFQSFEAHSGFRFDVRGGAPVLIATVALAAIISIATVTVFIELTAKTLDEIPAGETPDFASQQYHGAALRPATERISEYVYDATGSWIPGGTPSVLAPED